MRAYHKVGYYRLKARVLLPEWDNKRLSSRQVCLHSPMY